MYVPLKHKALFVTDWGCVYLFSSVSYRMLMDSNDDRIYANMLTLISVPLSFSLFFSPNRPDISGMG